MGITGRRRGTPRRGRSSRPGSTSGTRAAGRSKAVAQTTPTGTRQTGRDRALARVRTASLLRLRVGFLLIAMVVSVFAVRLFQLQGLDAATYAAQARAVGAVQEVLPATRGAITDRNGEPLAESLDGMMIVADPTKTGDDAAAIASVLEDRLGIDYIEAVENLSWPDENVQFRYIARRIPSTQATSVVSDLTEMGYKGLDTRRDPLRSYPAKDVGANLVGWINDEGNGADGAELLFSQLLAGKDGSTTYDIGGGNRIPLGDNSVVEPVNGTDVALTIDRDVQWYTQRVLQQTVEDVGAESGSAIVMDTQTGQLLSLADYPTFDPNTVTSAIDTRRLGSRALREVYEPGSVEKVLTMAALIDAGRVTPRTELSVPGQLSSSGRPINDHWVHGDIDLTLTGVLAKSSNIGTVLAARTMDPPQLRRYLTEFGLGERSGLEGYGEQPGILAPASAWSDIVRDNIAFGQGVAVNAVQMAAAVNTIANRGTYVQPSLVLGSAETEFGPLGSDHATTREVVSPEAAAKVTRMMEMVTDETEGTAPLAKVAGYRVAGKTGTAQVAENGSYSSDKFVISFAGFAPADDPRFTVYVVIHNPEGNVGGGGTGGPAFRKIMAYLLQRYAVAPSGAPSPQLPVEWQPGAGRGR
jgi:cell division protein FtsI (penicillin-binding protein 3)